MTTLNMHECAAIDPGIANCGFACGRCKKSFTFTTRAGGNVQLRLQASVKALTSHVKVCKINHVVIEDTFGSVMKHTNYQIGALLAGLEDSNVKFVAPSKWVRDIWGPTQAGNYKKKAMSLARKLTWKPYTQHEADAICLLHWFVTVSS